MEVITAAGRFAAPDESGATYVEHFRTLDLSIGTYSLNVGAVDPQRPHTEDEVYVVTSGKGRFTGGARTVDVEAGSVIFVPANEPHRFHDIAEDLAVLVFFGPAYGNRGSNSTATSLSPPSGAGA